MLLNLGLTADAAAAHANEPSNQPDTQPSTCATYSPTFLLSALPLLNSFCSPPRLPDGSTDCPGLVSAMVMSPIESASSSGEASNESSAVVARPRVSRSATGRKSRPKTSYQFAHPAAHARHKRLRFRPKLLLQLQQVSQAPRPLPVVDVLPSTSYLPLIARKFPAIYRTRNGLGPYDLIVVLSEQYDRTVGSIPEKRVSSEDEDEDHREVVATICQKYQEDARLKGKAEICLNFGPVWEASPLPSGSYEFVAQTESGVQIMRWALRGGRNRRMTTPGTQSREDGKRFTFSVIDPTTRRHPVLASMTRNQLEVNDEYSAAVRSGTGPTTPSSGMSVVSDASDADTPLDGGSVTLDDGLRTLIVITGVWVAFREGWSDNFRYGDAASSSGTKSSMSPTSVKFTSPTTAKNETDSFPDNDEDGKRCLSVSNIRRSTTPATVDGTKSTSLSKRSNSTGAAFMDRAKRRSASGLSTRLNRHSMFTALGENGRDIVVSRPPSPHQQSAEVEDSYRAGHPKAKSPAKAQPETENVGSNTVAGRDPASNSRIKQHGSTHKKKPDAPAPETVDSTSNKGKVRRRLSTFFGIFHRKHDTH
ncbi:hypothetical protein E8E15_011397 [Penicillium rubens]|jgi:hypothetical protein|uniref:Pc22g06160 protein n=2 Tax=Penicillium chrysogenum species complex TaxID=254878 RepID=B6HVK3_PENRW|nr:uncharacterized protein N7525_005613 [Penicillium rubens]KZN85737.1 hypothetical protein EN45_099320 [Penicillium chrysogenum]CAP97904.1 Pc22g06160 [Penicillium rubens Wisconsin 54-1255]KAF3030167.1 hypothetical protein E8E15_011397 [Penicillium rubens]KAJ5043738.1 hypothetical protein NUH16_000527 [Penicillium rubens]KAJ5840425.1 hypothetical protein N7525_005613 [Penicillium rubens]